MPLGEIEKGISAGRLTSRSLAEAMSRAHRMSPLLVQVMLLAAVPFSAVTTPRWALVLAGVAVIMCSAAALRFRLSTAIPLAACYFAIGLYYVAVGNPAEPLLGMLITLTSWAVAVPIMLMGSVGGPVVSGLLALVYGIGIAAVHPGWDPMISVRFLLTCAIVSSGSVLLIRWLREFARKADELDWNRVAGRFEVVRVRAMSDAAAEYVSVMHDTMVNTLGALARSASAGLDPESVRERCRRDLALMRSFLLGRTAQSGRGSFRDLERVGLPIRWSGSTRDNLTRYEALLPPDTVRALLGCATEAVLNSTKHSGAAYVVCEAGYEADEFVLRISDNGVGFEPAAVSERGIAHSIRARADRNAIRARIDSAPGAGTRVSLACRPGDALGDREGEIEANAETLTRAVTARFGMGWATFTAVAGLIGAVMNPVGQGVQSWVALTVILAVAAISWGVCRSEDESPRWFAASIIIVIPLSNLLLFASASRAGGLFFPSLALTALHTLLLATKRTPAWFLISVGMQIATVVVFIVWGPPLGRADVVSVLLLETPVLALLGIVFVFVRLIGTVGGHLAESNARILELERQAVRLEAERHVSVQWSAAALDGPFALLQGLADGSLSSGDPEVRLRCAAEEAYLRQLSAVPPDGTSMERWLRLAIVASRKRSVILVLDAEPADVPDVRDARALGAAILACIDRTAAGGELRVSLMPQQDSVLLLIVGTGEALANLSVSEGSGRLRIECRRLADQVLVEIRLERAAAVTGG